MKTKVLYFIAFVLSAFQLKAQAQQTEEAPAHLKLGSFSTQYSYSPFTIDGKKMNIQQVGGSLTLPVFYTMKDNKLDFLLAGVEYNGLFLSGTGPQFGGTQFNSFSVPITFQKALSPKYALLASFIPTLSSDLKDVSGEDMLYSAAVMLRIRKSATFSYSIGAAYSRQFFGNVLIPIVGIDWNISDRWTFNGTLPVSEKIKYKLSNKSFTGVSADFSVGGGSYRLSEKTGSDYLQVQQLRGSLFYEYMPVKNFSIQISAGYNFSQKLDRYTKDQKVDGLVPYNSLNNRVPSAEIEKKGVAFQTGINYRF
nr:DUF6268 family outer membrane beta-barrel protein [Mucilaginibacter sp. L294]